jgi:hypothetical protein
LSAACLARTRTATAPSCWNVVRGSNVCVALGIGSIPLLGVRPAFTQRTCWLAASFREALHSITSCCLLETKSTSAVLFVRDFQIARCALCAPGECVSALHQWSWPRWRGGRPKFLPAVARMGTPQILWPSIDPYPSHNAR